MRAFLLTCPLNTGCAVDSTINQKDSDKPNEGGGNFGDRRNGGRLHAGVDLQGARGEIVVATGDGVVSRADESDSGGYGKQVKIDHGGGIETRAGHLDEMFVKPGEPVRAGQPIGLMGRTGSVPGDTHTHQEVIVDGRAIDPANVLPGLRARRR